MDNCSRLFLLEVCEKRDEGNDPRNHTNFHEIRRANLVFISCGFVDRVLAFVFQQPARPPELNLRSQVRAS